MRELRERGVPWLLKQLPADPSVFLAFDCDGLTRLSSRRSRRWPLASLSYAEARDLLAGIGSRLVGAVFTEFVPALDVNDLCAVVAARLVSALVVEE